MGNVKRKVKSYEWVIRQCSHNEITFLKGNARNQIVIEMKNDFSGLIGRLNMVKKNQWRVRKINRKKKERSIEILQRNDKKQQQ